MFSYKEQLAWVKWGKNHTSSIFGISNGTRQGSVASPTFWAVYLDPLFKILRSLGVGCHVGGLFMGIVGYADDILLLAPSLRAAQTMLNVCENFASSRNIKFSTNKDVSKSKCKAMFLSGSKKPSNIPPLILCGEALPWVDRCEHLGHTLTCDGQMDQDVKEKVTQLVDSTVKTRETFRFAHPTEQIEAMEKYCLSIYGSNLWRLEDCLSTQWCLEYRKEISLECSPGL